MVQSMIENALLGRLGGGGGLGGDGEGGRGLVINSGAGINNGQVFTRIFT
jgi:hypothetical protein